MNIKSSTTHLVFILFFLAGNKGVYAQGNSENRVKASIPKCQIFLDQAGELERASGDEGEDKYLKIIDLYNAARRCDPSISAKIGEKINEVFKKIDGERANAVKAEEAAQKERARAREAEKEARIAEKEAKEAEKEAIKAKDEAIKAKNIAERMGYASQNAVLALEVGRTDPTLALGMAERNYRIYPETSAAFGIFQQKLNDIHHLKSWRTIGKGHDAAVTAVAFSDSLMLTGSSDNTVKLWTIEGKELLTFRGHRAAITSVAFSPDGKYAISSSMDKNAKIWNLTNDDEILVYTLKGHKGVVTNAAFFPDDPKKVLTSSMDKTLKLWELEADTFAMKKSLLGHEGGVTSFVFSNKGSQILSSSTDGVAKLWSAHGANEIRAFEKGHTAAITTLAFSPDDQQILTGSKDSTAVLWEVYGTKQHTFEHSKPVQVVAFEKDGKHIFTSTIGETIWKDKDISKMNLSNDNAPKAEDEPKARGILDEQSKGGDIAEVQESGKAQVWSIEGEALHVFENITPNATMVSFSHFNQVFYNSDEGGNLLRYSLNGTGGKDTTTQFLQKQPVKAVAFCPEGQHFLFCTGKLAKLHKITGEEIHQFEHPDVIIAAAFSPDGQYLITTSQDSVVTIWDKEKQTIVELIKGKGNGTALTFSSDGQHLAIGTENKGVYLYDGKQFSQKKHLKKPNDRVSSLAFSPDGKYLLVGFAMRNTAHLLDAESFDKVATIPNSVAAAAFSPNGQYILSGAWDKNSKLWSVNRLLNQQTKANNNQTGKRKQKAAENNNPSMIESNITSHTAPITSVAYSPNGHFVATGSSDKTCKLWGTENGKEYHFIGHTDGVNSIAFSPNGHYLLTGSEDGTVKLCIINDTSPKIIVKGNDKFETVAFSKNSGRLLTYTDENFLQLWTLDGHELLALNKREGFLNISIAPDEQTIIGNSADSTVFIWNIHNMKKPKEIFKHDKEIKHITFSPNGENIIVVSDGQEVEIEVATGQKVREEEVFSEEGSSLTSLHYFHERKYRIDCFDDGTAKVWENGKIFRQDSIITSVDFFLSNNYVLTGSRTSKVAKLWTLDGKELQSFPEDSPIVSVAFSPDGEGIIIATEKEIKIYPSPQKLMKQVQDYSLGELKSRSYQEKPQDRTDAFFKRKRQLEKLARTNTLSKIFTEIQTYLLYKEYKRDDYSLEELEKRLEGVNQNAYTGICLYNIGERELAKKYFQKSWEESNEVQPLIYLDEITFKDSTKYVEKFLEVDDEPGLLHAFYHCRNDKERKDITEQLIDKINLTTAPFSYRVALYEYRGETDEQFNELFLSQDTIILRQAIAHFQGPEKTQLRHKLLEKVPADIINRYELSNMENDFESYFLSSPDPKTVNDFMLLFHNKWMTKKGKPFVVRETKDNRAKCLLQLYDHYITLEDKTSPIDTSLYRAFARDYIWEKLEDLNTRKVEEIYNQAIQIIPNDLELSDYSICLELLKGKYRTAKKTYSKSDDESDERNEQLSTKLKTLLEKNRITGQQEVAINKFLEKTTNNPRG